MDVIERKKNFEPIIFDFYFVSNRLPELNRKTISRDAEKLQKSFADYFGSELLVQRGLSIV